MKNIPSVFSLLLKITKTCHVCQTRWWMWTRWQSDFCLWYLTNRREREKGKSSWHDTLDFSAVRSLWHWINSVITPQHLRWHHSVQLQSCMVQPAVERDEDSLMSSSPTEVISASILVSQAPSITVELKAGLLFWHMCLPTSRPALTPNLLTRVIVGFVVSGLTHEFCLNCVFDIVIWLGSGAGLHLDTKQTWLGLMMTNIFLCLISYHISPLFSVQASLVWSQVNETDGGVGCVLCHWLLSEHMCLGEA